MKIYNLTKRYGSFMLDITNMEVKKGEIRGIIGSNGSGKTTCMKIISGLIVPDNGIIDLEGLSFRDITMITRKPYMLKGTVVNNLIYPLKLRGIKPDKDLTDHYLEIAGLKDAKDSYALSLSSGQQQKLAFVRALIFSPKLILIDEAFSNMDIESLSFFENYMLSSLAKSQTSWLIISHQLSIVKRLCSYVYFMKEGSVQCEGSINDVIFNTQDSSLKKYLQYS